ncbi:MAG: hypothetical protein DRO88_03050 [Promethearchaeia archaeon]|nr:MAG: hypothetical protein DRO88_03050 [Candidatus Lokiarchaeia archaeon]
MSEEIWLEFECPICHAKKEVKLPQILFKKNITSLKKVQIDSSICCEHTFIAFISPSLKVIGYETVDMIAELNKSVEKLSQIITLEKILKDFGEDITKLIFHAVIIETPIIILIKAEDKSKIAMKLNYFFNQILPVDLKNPFLFSEISNENQLIDQNQTDKALIITSDKNVKDISWQSIPFYYEQELIEKAMEILDPKMQLEVLKVSLETLFSYTTEINKIFKEWEQLDRRYYRKLGKIHEYQPKIIYFEDLQSVAEKEFPNQISRYGLQLIAQILRNRFHVNFYIDNFFDQDVKKKMPKAKGKRKLFTK